MNKAQLIKAIATDTHLSQATVESFLVSLEKTVTAEVRKGDGVVKIPGLCSFAVQDRAERNARNPATGEPMVVPAKRVIKAKSLFDL